MSNTRKTDINMNTHSSYYVVELRTLKPDTTYSQSVVVYDGQGNKTKFMALNKESIPVLIKFLQNELERISK